MKATTTSIRQFIYRLKMLFIDSAQPLVPIRVRIVWFALIFSGFATMKAQVPMVRLSMSGPNNSLDETVVYYQQGATDGFDSNYDAYKLFGPNAAPAIAQKHGGVLMQINGISPVSQTFSIPVLAKTNNTGTFTITSSDHYFLPSGTCLKLNDLFTGAQVDIKNASYTFSLSDTTSVPRFVLEINCSPLQVLTQLFQPSCADANGGQCVIQGLNSAAYNYTWKDTAGAILKTSLNKVGADTLSQLFAGTFIAEVQAAGGCAFTTDTFVIQPVIVPVADFASADTVFLSNGGVFQATNTSVNGLSYEWNFGDVASSTNDVDGSWIYTSEGEFVLTLVATSVSSCTDTSTKVITVIDLTTGVNYVDAAPEIKWCTVGENRFSVVCSSSEMMGFGVRDVQGKLVFGEKRSGGVNDFDLNHLSRGTYIMEVSSATQHSVFRFLIN
jgi:hypothetical protein